MALPVGVGVSGLAEVGVSWAEGVLERVGECGEGLEGRGWVASMSFSGEPRLCSCGGGVTETPLILFARAT